VRALLFAHQDFCTYPALVQHVSCAVAGARGDSASVAYAAEVNGLAAVCDAVTPRAARAVPSACSACICHISCAAALARGDARAAADLFVSVCVCQRERKREKMITNDSIQDHEHARVSPTRVLSTPCLMVSQRVYTSRERDLAIPPRRRRTSYSVRCNFNLRAIRYER